MPTVRDISKMCGVAQSTVSKALNGYGDISRETSEKVLAAARELGFRPNSAARQLRTKRSYSIGILLTSIVHGGLSHEYYAKLMDNIRNEAENNGYDITYISRSIGKDRLSYLNYCEYKNIDGILFVCADIYDPEVVDLLGSSFPKVAIDYRIGDCSTIVSDNIDGMRMLVEHAYQCGHRRIAFVTGEKSPVTQRRTASFFNTCEKLGLDIPEAYVPEALYHDLKASYDATRALLRLPVPPTCIFYPDDYSYVGGADAITEAGLSVPKDISAAGYDGIGVSQLLRPRLTTIWQDTEQMGQLAVRRLVSAIEAPRTYIPDETLVPVRLLEGQSIAPITSET